MTKDIIPAGDLSPAIIKVKDIDVSDCVAAIHPFNSSIQFYIRDSKGQTVLDHTGEDVLKVWVMLHNVEVIKGKKTLYKW